MRNILITLLPVLLASCGTVIPVPDFMFADNPRKRVAIGNPQNQPRQFLQPQPRSQPQPRRTFGRRPPVAARIPGKPGFVYSPYAQGRMVDVRDLPSGIVVKDPYTGNPLTVP